MKRTIIKIILLMLFAIIETTLILCLIKVQQQETKVEEIQIYHMQIPLASTLPSAEIRLLVAEEVESEYTEEDLRYMSAIIFAEAGNQCEAGQAAVGIVIMNRVASEDFEDTVYDVIYQEGQFTPVTNGSLKKALKLYDNGEIPNEIIEVAEYVLQGNTTVEYNNQEYNLSDYLYFSKYIKNCRLQIEDHQFR